jgi:outer membrane protein assembly factor BamD
MNKCLVFITLVYISLGLAGCASQPLVNDSNLSAQEIYQAGLTELNKERYAKAVAHFQNLEAKYPFGHYAEQAQLELIYAYFMNDEYEAAHATANNFIRLNPDYPQVDYAYYMRGLASYNENRGIFVNYLASDLSELDLAGVHRAFNEFSQLVQLFPNSQFAPDARQRMIYIKNLLAQQQLNAATFDMRKGEFVGAVNRSQYIIKHFQGTPAVPSALAMLVNAYTHLGLKDLAASTLEVLRTNYPDYKNLDSKGQLNLKKEPQPERKSLLSAITFGLF